MNNGTYFKVWGGLVQNEEYHWLQIFWVRRHLKIQRSFSEDGDVIEIVYMRVCIKINFETKPLYITHSIVGGNVRIILYT